MTRSDAVSYTHLDVYKRQEQTCVLQHDNIPAHASLLVINYLAKQQYNCSAPPTYSPYLATADFFLFPQLKSILKGSHFQTIEEIKKNTEEQVHAIPKSTFQELFQNLKK